MILSYALAAVLVTSGVQCQNYDTDTGNTTKDEFSYSFNDTKGTTLAIMELKDNPIQLLLNKKVLNKDKKWSWRADGATYLNSKASSVSATNTSGANTTQQIITATLQFNDLKQPPFISPTSNVTLTKATLVLIFELGGHANAYGYWNMTKATIDIEYTNKTKTETVPGTLSTDITPPKFGYTTSKADAACTEGYGVCAPLGLHWSCYDQLLSPDLQTHKNNTYAIFVKLPGGLALLPFPNNRTVGTTYNWDCTPLIPISLWTSLLITLGLAAVVAWALTMLSALPTPDQWDDPKKPGIYIPQTE